MMRLISCALTMYQVRAETKTETRRLGWSFARPGERLIVVEKAMGLGPGGRPRPLKCVEIVAAKRERLDAIDADAVEREGFPEMDPVRFVAMFCREMRCKSETVVTVLRWRYLQREDLTDAELEQWDRLVARWLARTAIDWERDGA